MIYKEEYRDLFSVPDDYHLAHCISADFKLGAGIAVQFDKKFQCRNRLFELYPNSRVPYWDRLQDRFKGICVVTDPVYNLITKRNYWDKPTLLTMRNALNWMKEDCEIRSIKKIAMPMIGCGLDRLKWEDVSEIINNVFKDVDIEILICKRDEG